MNRAIGGLKARARLARVQLAIVDVEFRGGAGRTGRARAPTLEASNSVMHDDSNRAGESGGSLGVLDF